MSQPPDTKHQIITDPENMKVTLTGRLLGHEYGGVFDLLTGSVEWLQEIVWHQPPKDVVTHAKQDRTCPGCTRGVLKLLRGGMGWAKSALRLDQAPPEVIAERQAKCESCPLGLHDFGICRDDWPNKPRKDQGCGCVLALKVTQKSEQCPHKLWLKYDAGN